MYVIQILGIDPGGSTGWAKATITGKNKTEAWAEGSLHWESGQLEYDDHYLDLRSIISRHTRLGNNPGEARIICEGFDNRGSAAVELVSLEYIGVVKGYVQEWPSIELIMRAAHQKEWADDKKLKALGVYDKSSKHSNDAKRHIVGWLCNDKHFMPVLKGLRKGLHPEDVHE